MSANSALRDRLVTLRDALTEGLVERDIPVRLALLAAMAGEHLLLLGPPGTAKSELARRLRRVIRDGRYFERLLTRFSVPEELFGPLSIKELEQDRYHRQIEGYVPSSHIVFLDEIFKANSAILNSLLTLLNEREFDNGTSRLQTPLVSVVGASNELPQGEELDALYDRFLLRYHVNPVTDEGFSSLLRLKGSGASTVEHALAFTPTELLEVRQVATTVDLGDDVRDLLRAMRKFLAEQQIFVSDRRWRKIVGLLRVAALTDGRSRVSMWDAWLLQHCVWQKPEQQGAVHAWYEQQVGAATPSDPVRLLQLVQRQEELLSREQQKMEQGVDSEGKLLYSSESGQPSTEVRGWVQKKRGEAPLFLSPADWGDDRTNNGKGYTREELQRLSASHYWSGTSVSDEYWASPNNWFQVQIERTPLMVPARYSEQHVRGRVGDVRKMRELVAVHLQAVAQQLATASEQIRSHLWVDPHFSEPALANLRTAQRQARDLERKLQAVEGGFDGLPRSEPEVLESTG